MVNYENYDEEIIQAIDKYMPELKDMDEETLIHTIEDIKQSTKKYHLNNYSKYFKYSFWNMDDKTRATFFGDADYTECVKNSFDTPSDNDLIFKDKFETYKIYKDYYKREIIAVRSFEDYNDFVGFVTRNPVFIAKDMIGSLGINVRKVKITNPAQIKTIFFKIIQQGGSFCEEWINQCSEFSQFNESSVNTIRVATVYDNRGLTPMYAMFRSGRDGNIVDNASNGGIAAAIDFQTGKIISDGYTKISLEHFECHPNSGVKYKGFQIPRWNEVLPLVEELHKMHLKSKIVGWDLTLTDNGWVLIEGNSKPNIDTIQMIHYNTFGKGLRDVIENAIGKYRP